MACVNMSDHQLMGKTIHAHSYLHDFKGDNTNLSFNRIGTIQFGSYDAIMVSYGSLVTIKKIRYFFLCSFGSHWAINTVSSWCLGGKSLQRCSISSPYPLKMITPGKEALPTKLNPMYSAQTLFAVLWL